MPQPSVNESLARKLKSLKGWLPESPFLMLRKPVAAAPSAASVPQQTGGVFSGNLNSELVFISATEFEVGPKQLLEKMIQAMGTKADQVCIITGLPFSGSQVQQESVLAKVPRAKVIVVLSEFRVKNYSLGAVTVISTFHPDYLSKNPEAKKEAWEDLKGAIRILGWQP